MPHVRVSTPEGSVVLGKRIRMANNVWLRFRGLMGVRHLAVGEGILFPHTNAVHGFFMSIPLRLIYLNRAGYIVRIATLQPWTLGPVVRGAYWVLELPLEAPTGGLAAGVRLIWTPVGG